MCSSTSIKRWETTECSPHVWFFFPEGPNFENFSPRLKIQKDIENIVVLNLSQDTELKLISTNKFYYQSIKFSLDRGCTHFCICAINKGKLNLCLTFVNRIFNAGLLKWVGLYSLTWSTSLRLVQIQFNYNPFVLFLFTKSSLSFMCIPTSQNDLVSRYYASWLILGCQNLGKKSNITH